MARYGRDYGMNRGGWNAGGMNRGYDMDFGGSRSRGNQFAGRGGGFSDMGRDSTFRGGYGYGGDRWSGSERGMSGGWDAGRSGSFQGRGGFDRESGFRDRMTFRAGGHPYDRDFQGGSDQGFTDRVRSGWNELKENARDMMGGHDYDRGYRRRY